MTAWSHADHPAAAALARRLGFEAVRRLWVMTREAGPVGVPRSDGVTIRGYRDSDAEEVIRVNAAAFAHHPEQGSMDAANLAERMAEPWFDPAGLLVADAGERAAGLPLDQAALPRPGRGVRRRRRPGRPGPRARSRGHRRRPLPPRLARRPPDHPVRRVRQRRPPSRRTPGSASRTPRPTSSTPAFEVRAQTGGRSARPTSGSTSTSWAAGSPSTSSWTSRGTLRLTSARAIGPSSW